MIWKPDFTRKAQNYPEMLRHNKFVNFSCKQPDEYDTMKTACRLPDIPVIRYTENTISRISYIHPSRFKNLAPDYNKPKASGNPDKKAVTGIVPNLIVPAYLPVIEK
ncbi:uncharacterized protein LOC123559459 [Mercenaria mercenaria]|uniref:uncharacterized protein LOC123559459 n=1 Tax=Mercenaria mercenaria TaxID=6596 RepID=UPI00234E65A1|nr:uncharacterized protein LOC123559459 [Mercenaria mercenaria]